VNIKQISAVGLKVGDFDTFADKELAAIKLLEHCAAIGSDFALFPETINIYCGDGPDNPRSMTISEVAFDDLKPVSRLLGRAKELKIGLGFGLFLRENNHLHNYLFVYDKDGCDCGRYSKRFPTAGELDAGVIPGKSDQKLIEWEGLKAAGAICFDTQFEEIFADQKDSGADLMLIPSMWSGGSPVDIYAYKYSLPTVLAYCAWSKIIGIDGKIVVETGYRSEALRFGMSLPIATAKINFDSKAFHLEYNGQFIPEIEKRYGPKVKLVLDNPNSVFYLSSHSPDLTVADVIKEYKLIVFQDMLKIYRKKLAAMPQ
jgi:predicted amidohydrolase